MKSTTKLYLYGALAIVLVILAVSLYGSRPSANELSIQQCVTNGGTIDPANGACVLGSSTPATQTQSASAPSRASQPSKAMVSVPSSPARPASYSIHLSVDGPVFYYTPTTTVASQISIFNPPTHTIITSPLTVSGTAVGNWFFEGSFPVILTDWDGRIIAQTTARALSDWQTTDMVPFSATLVFPSQLSGSRGALILKKDNPSGLSKNDASVEMAVTFQ